ncbi:MAG: Eco57I restriction-modification methylase domain-containing protein [Halolamina sp.]
MTGTRTRGGFVVSAVEAIRGLFDDTPAGDAADYVPTLTRRLFDGVLGYDDIAYSQREDWGQVTFVDEEGRPAIVLAAAAPGADVRTARQRAIGALDDEPSARYAIATNRDRLLVLARCSPTHADADVYRGVTARELTDIHLRATVERSDDRSLAEALTPDQQLSLAKLTALQRDAVTAAVETPEGDEAEPTFGDLMGSNVESETSPETLADALTETLTDVLVPAVADAFDRLSHRIQEFADRESAIEAQIEAAKAEGDGAAVTDYRADLFDLREEYATARRLEAGFARWRRVADDEASDAEIADAFATESAAVALDTLLLARVAADRGLAGDLGAYREFWADQAEHAQRDAADLVRAVREELSGVSEDATDDGTFAWVFEADIADAFATAIGTLEAVNVADLDAIELTAAFDDHLGADARPVQGSTRPATAGLLLDRAGYTADAVIDDAALLDPACGDGSLLVGAADRLLARLDRTDATAAETLETVRDRLHGFDVHPYAVHLAESRLLLRTVDVHADAALADGEFSLGRFGIHRTDALRRDGRRVSEATAGTRARRRAAAAAVKSREDFDYVVSDAPTGREAVTPAAYDEYRNAVAGADRSALFLERAADWLRAGGRLSMAVDGSLLDGDAVADARSRLIASFRVRELIEFDTGAGAAPLFVAAERAVEADPSAFTYARVTPTFLDLVREGLIRPGSGDRPTPAELVSRCLPDEAGGDPPSMATVLVELDLVCDATVDGSMPVEVRSVDGDALQRAAWTLRDGGDGTGPGAVPASPREDGVADELEIDGSQPGPSEE